VEEVIGNEANVLQDRLGVKARCTR